MNARAQTLRRPHAALSGLLLASAVFWFVWATLCGPWPWIPLGFAGIRPESLGPERFLFVACGTGWAVALGLASIRPTHTWPMLLAAEIAGLAILVTFGLRFVLHGIDAWYEPMTPLFVLLWGVGYAWVLNRLWSELRSGGSAVHGLPPEVLEGYLEMADTQHDTSVAELSREHPVMLIFLRHFGCTFCREALGDLAARRREIERRGFRIVLVHMSDEDGADAFLAKYGLETVDRVRDSDCELYRAFGLERATLGQIFGPRVWWRGAIAALAGGHGIGWLDGDGFRMPGIFIVRAGRVIRAYRHDSASSRPDYLSLAECAQDCDATPARHESLGRAQTA